MNRRNGISAVELLVVFAVLVVIAIILFPIFYRSSGHHRVGNCQSNLTQIGRALKMYMTDWDDTYPTNCTKSGVIRPSVKLSPYDPVNQTRFVYGYNWVEALFNYIEATTKKDDPMSVWRCTTCPTETYPVGSDTAVVSYVFNRNLLQLPGDYVTSPASVMLVRETDRLLNSDLRPINLSRKNPSAPPQSPFLTRSDVRMGKTKPDLHNKGSHVLFADGHVKYFNQEFFAGSPQWDPETQQWWNRVSGKPGIDKTIAITP